MLIEEGWMNRCALSICILPFLVTLNGQAQGESSEVQKHIERVTGCLHTPVMVMGDPCIPLEKRMEELHVHGVSIAVIHGGKIEWARGFGVAGVGGAQVTPETMFQAGSISKPVAAMAALSLVEKKKLSLDADVNSELTTWKLPTAQAANGKSVTLRELLTHTGGTTVHGFPGYAKGEPVPTLVQVLNGEKPANTPAIRIETEPGTKWNYSGGGFTIMQQMVLDVTKEPFPKVVHDAVLGPFGMKRSTYEQPLPATMGPAAAPYNFDGTPVAGGAHTYPEMAAAGLWTTPSDLALYVMEVQQALTGKSSRALTQTMTEEMLKPGMGNWGLGVQIGGAASDRYFEHGGVNAGFEALFVGYEKHGDGAVVMTNAQGGLRLADELMHSIAAEYGWPDFKQVVKGEVKVDPAVLTKYVGTYTLMPGFDMTVTLDGDHLVTQATRQGKVPMFAESETKFATRAINAEIEFLTDADGKTTEMVLHQNGHDMKGAKKN
jgi:CubicO group peptidase (beta-lactamase class C family)